MTTATVTGRLTLVPTPPGGPLQSPHDSLVVARRNLLRIPDPVGRYQPRSISQRAQGLHVSAGKEQAK